MGYVTPNYSRGIYPPANSKWWRHEGKKQKPSPARSWRRRHPRELKERKNSASTMAENLDIDAARRRMIARRFGGKSAAIGGKGTVRRKHKAVSYFAPVTERDTLGENWYPKTTPEEREKQAALTTTLLYILAFITTTILTGSLTIAGVVVGPACAAANFAANFAITSANSVITVPTALFLIEELAPSLCQAAKKARPTMLRILCFAYLDLELRLREVLLPVFIITDLCLRCLYLGMVLLTNPGCAWALARRTARCTCYAAAFGLWSFPYWAWSASDVLWCAGWQGLSQILPRRILGLGWCTADPLWRLWWMPLECALPWPIMGSRGLAPLLQTIVGRPARLWTRRRSLGNIVPCCCAAIAVTARLLVGAFLLMMVRRPAPLFGGASDSEEVDYESSSSEDEADFIAVALRVARPWQNAALRRYGAGLRQQGEVFVGVPRENSGGGNCLFLSLADGARELGLLAGATGASMRQAIVDFVVNEGHDHVLRGTTTLGNAVFDQFAMGVSDYAEEMAKDGVWGGYTEIAAFSLMLGCPVEVYEKSDGTFKRLFDFGTKNGTDRIVRIAFTGGDHYRYLEAGGLGPAAAGQGPSADPPADNRAEDPDFDGGALVGRPVLKWFPAVRAWFGGWVTEARPPSSDSSESRWLFGVDYEDEDHEDLELEELEAVLQPPDPEGHQLHSSNEWRKLKKLYEDVRASLLDGSFDGSDRACIQKFFRFQRPGTVTQQGVKKKFNKLRKSIHPDKVTREPPQVRHLARLLWSAMRHLQETYCGYDKPEARPVPADYPEYWTAAFAEAADCAQEVLSPPDPLTPPSPADQQPRSRAGPANDPAGADGPAAGSRSIRERSDPSNDLNCVDAFDLTDFVLSPFYHPESIPRDCMELWARAFARASQELIDALDSSAPDRDMKIGTAARWYLGLPQLMLRDNGRSAARRNAAIKGRLNGYLHGDYKAVVQRWRDDYDKAASRTRTPRPETKDRRLAQCLKLIYQGFISRGLRVLEGFGKASADDPAVFEQMLRKHPQDEERWSAPTRADDGSDEPDLTLLRQAVKDADPKVGVGPRGFRSNYAKALIFGRFADSEAKVAFGNFETLGKRYLDCSMPPWLRRQFGSGLLTPLAKAEAAPGETVDARPTKAEDTDTALWCQALQRSHTPKPKNGAAAEGIRKHLQPQQLSVGVSGGCDILVLGLKLKIEEAVSKGLKRVLVSLDLKNAHNSFNRREAQEALEALAAADPSLRSLVLAHHAISSQFNPIYVRSASTGNGLRYLCESRVGGGQGNALTNIIFPTVINDALKSTERDHDVEVRAQQDDISIFGDPAEIFGPGKALETILEKLGKVGLEPKCSEPPKTPALTNPSGSTRPSSSRAQSREPASRSPRQRQQLPLRPRPPHHQMTQRPPPRSQPRRRRRPRKHGGVFPERRAHTEFGSAALLWGPRDTSRRSSRRCKIGSVDKATRRVPC